MSTAEKEWLSLSQASHLLGVHETTLRRWVDAGQIPCFRTPGGHRRFTVSDLTAWMGGQQATALAPQTETLMQSAVGFTRQEMVERHVSSEAWYLAFDQEDERQRMRESGRHLLGLTIQYMGRVGNREKMVEEGRRIGQFYGQQCAQHGISLVDSMRAFFFFRESLLRTARPGLFGRGQYDAEEVRVHRELRQFLDEVMYACLASYEAACRHLLGTGVKS
ncbi:MAG: helix-turn-helix domain-containing protein [Chloroflexota bacterium]